MYREKADVECDDLQARAQDLETADHWVDKTMATKKAKAKKISLLQHPNPNKIARETSSEKSGPPHETTKKIQAEPLALLRALSARPQRSQRLKAFALTTAKALNRRVRNETPAENAEKNLLDLQGNPYGTQSPIKIFVSCGALALRFDAHTSFFPSGENIGKPSKPSL